MTWSKTTVKVKHPEHNPIHILYLAAKQIMEIHKSASEKAGRAWDGRQHTVPIWIKDAPRMKITIDMGPETEAEYAIFQAQTK